MKKLWLAFVLLTTALTVIPVQAETLGDIHVTGINFYTHSGHIHLHPVYTIGRYPGSISCEYQGGFTAYIKQVRNGAIVGLYFIPMRTVSYNDSYPTFATCNDFVCEDAEESCGLKINGTTTSPGTVVDHGECEDGLRYCFCEVTGIEDPIGVQISFGTISSGDQFVVTVHPNFQGELNFMDVDSSNDVYIYTWP